MIPRCQRGGPGSTPGWRTFLFIARKKNRFVHRNFFLPEQKMRRPGIEPGPPAWKAGILATELSTRVIDRI